MPGPLKPGGRPARARGILRLAFLLSLGLVMGLALVALVGCGSSDNGVTSKSGKEILQASKAAAVSASSVHVVGKNTKGPLLLSINLRLAGNGGRGQVEVTALGINFELIRIGNTLYVKGDSGFYRRFGAALGGGQNVPRGTWLKASANGGPLARLGAFADLRGELGRLLSIPSSVTKGARTTVNGQKVIELKETAKVYKGSLYVATNGKPYPVQLVKNGGRERGRTTFSEWNKDVSLTAPSPAVDVSTLKS